MLQTRSSLRWVGVERRWGFLGEKVKIWSLAVVAATAFAYLGAVPAMAAPSDVLDVGGVPVGVVVGPDGTAYVGNYGAAGGISVIPPGAVRPSRTISTGGFTSGLAMAPDSTLYVAERDSASNQYDVGVIPAGATGVARRIPVSSGSHLIAAGPDGTIYVPNSLEHTVSVIAPDGSTVDRTVPVGEGPVEVAVTKDGTAFVANQIAGSPGPFRSARRQEAQRIPTGSPRALTEQFMSPTSVPISSQSSNRALTRSHTVSSSREDPKRQSSARTVPSL
jgi:YVTN family beta-propeller protein